MTDGNSGTRIAKVLARAGVASRRQAEVMIADGRVAVNGRRIESPALNVGPGDRISVDGMPLSPPEPMRLWLHHKPAGLVTTERDEKGRPTVFERLPKDLPRVMSVGRLDLNSEGLLLLTNDGALKRRLELPTTGWLRKYRARVHGAPSDAMLEPLRKGIELDGERFQPMRVTLDRQQGANAWLTMGIREGRNREVRRALAAVGLVVNRLIRVSYGPFQLGVLAPGQVEEVKPRVLRDQLGHDDGGDDQTESPPHKTTSRAARSAATDRPPRAGGPAAARKHAGLSGARKGSGPTAVRMGKSPRPRGPAEDGAPTATDRAKDRPHRARPTTPRPRGPKPGTGGGRR